MGDRYVVLGLARPRSRWFTDVGRWATSGSLPVEFVRCVSAEELQRRVGAGRRFSAALVDAGLPTVDRDLLEGLRQAGIAPVVVADDSRSTDWLQLGAVAVLPASPTRADLLDVLSTHAVMIDRLEPELVLSEGHGPWDRPGTLVAVTGPGGVGTSTTAMALAQGLAGSPVAVNSALAGGRVLLADLCLHAELAMLHDARDVAPGFPEVVDLHRGGTPGPERLRPMAFEAVERGYDLLLGLRRAADWTVHRPAAVEAAVAGLRRAWQCVVADIDAVFEGESDTGSTDVEERHAMARTAATVADLVVVVGRPGVKWLHGLVRVLDDLGRLDVAPERLQPVVVDAPRSPRLRAEVARTIAGLASPRVRSGLAAPIFLPGRGVASAVRDGAPLPAHLARSLASGVLAGIDRARPVTATAGHPTAGEAPVAIVPGTLGIADDEGMVA